MTEPVHWTSVGRWLSLRNRRGYIGQIFDYADAKEEGVVESIETDIPLVGKAQKPGTENSNNQHQNKMHSSVIASTGNHEDMHHSGFSVGSGRTESTDTGVDPWSFDDTSILIQNHSPVNPFVVSSTPQAHSHRRPQTPYAVRPNPGNEYVYRNPFDNTPHALPNVKSRKVLDRTNSTCDSLDGRHDTFLEGSVSSEHDVDADTTIVTQVHIQQSTRMNMGSEDLLGPDEDILMFD